jgi:arylsulfate sulfotransferase
LSLALVGGLLLLIAGFGKARAVTQQAIVQDWKSDNTVTANSAGKVSRTRNHLVAQYTVPVKRRASVYVEFGTDTTYGLRTSAQQTPADGGIVSILVAGMKQNTTYHMRAILTYSDGTVRYDPDHNFETGAIAPALLPKVSVTVPAGMIPAPGVELSTLSPGPQTLVAFDPSGDIIWYYHYHDRSLGSPQPAKLLKNGHILMVLYGSGHEGTLREIDLAGNIVRQLSVRRLNQRLRTSGYDLKVYSLNHDILPLPNGHLLVLSSDLKTFTDLPGYPGKTIVTGNDIVDLDSNYKPVWIWKAFDHLDVNRHPMNFPDWTHANALVYSPDDGNLLFSLRHQHWVIKIDYRNGAGTGNVLWRLGYQGDFALAMGAPANWFYAQHDASILSTNSTGDFLLGIFDNGDNRVLDEDGTVCGSSGAPACYSRPRLSR